MSCPARAVLIVTHSVKGTSTNVARRRVELACAEPEGHAGPHSDRTHDEAWEGAVDQVVTVLRHED
ncbi:MAG: hypothetical protein IPI67_27340 [Myxococcales bacterium]|nr:hypothetical protein [Myxococcales bacterium]